MILEVRVLLYKSLSLLTFAMGIETFYFNLIYSILYLLVILSSRTFCLLMVDLALT